MALKGITLALKNTFNTLKPTHDNSKHSKSTSGASPERHGAVFDAQNPLNNSRDTRDACSTGKGECSQNCQREAG
jgi:hypothetical protein